MSVLDWNQFGIKGVSKRDSFEELCLHLFCREHKLSNGISGDFNQAGLETEPVYVKGKCYGFQSKFFDKKVDYGQIKDSIDTALAKHGTKLDVIYVYLNLDAKPHSSQSGKDIEDEAAKHNVKIKWITRNNFTVSLIKPKNLDLAQLYFGYGQEFNFLQDNADYKKITLLKSGQFLKLNFLDSKNKKVSQLDNAILGSSEKMVLITGDPASGKSTLIHQLFIQYAGLNESTELKMSNKIIANGAIPQIVNLKLCVSDSLENIIRGRQNDFSLRGTPLGLIYLLDGLDELNQDRADAILLQIMELSQKSTTHKIVVTCRTGNFNRLQFKSYFKNSEDYRVGQLSIVDIDKYFIAKTDTDRLAAYNNLKTINIKLIDSVTDVLGLTLLWESISLLDEHSTILDLYELKVKKVLHDPMHYKDLPALNLPNPKEDAIIKLNEQVSFKFHEKFQFLLPIKELQALVSNLYPKADYHSINAIINYIAGLFFDTTPGSPGESYYIYKHRRYQEYFFVKLLQKKYDSDPLILRKVSILSNQELFQTFFMKGLKKVYIENNDLKGSLDLSLLDVYLGNHSGWGVDSPYYLNSDDFITSLIYQQDAVFNTLIEDENLNLKRKIFIDTAQLKKKFAEWELDTDNYRSQEYLINAWENGISRLMQLIVEFWKSGRTEIALQVITNVQEVQKLFDKYKFVKTLATKNKERRRYLHDPYSSNFSAWLYYLVNIKEEDIQKIYDEQVVPNMRKSRNVSITEDDERGVVQDFISTVLNSKPNKLLELMGILDDDSKISLLVQLTNSSKIKLFIQNEEIHEPTRLFIENLDLEFNKYNYRILFYKRYFSIPLNQVELDFLEQRKDEIFQERDVDWHVKNFSEQFGVICFILDIFSFEEELEAEVKQHSHHLNFYSERVVYAVLFTSYISMLRKEVTFEYIYRQYAKYCDLNDDTRYKSKVLEYSIATLWVLIYGDSDKDNAVKKELMKRLLNDLFIPKYSFYRELNSRFPTLFSEVVSESEINMFESELENWSDDFQSKVDRYLQLSLMYRDLNPQKASELFIKAIVDGTLRHGWRKDPIVHYDLVNSLSDVLQKQWLKGKHADSVIETVYKLTLRAYEVSDGSGTHRGPYRLIENLAKYDRDIAIKYKNKYIEYEGRYNIANSLFTPIILSKVRVGLPIADIEEDFNEFRLGYDYESLPESSYYEQKFIIYLEIAKSELYPPEDRKEALSKASALVTEMKEKGVKYYLSDSDFRKEKSEYIRLCLEFEIEAELQKPSKEDSYSKPYSKVSEQKFQNELLDAKTMQKIRGLYQKLNNYKNNIYLRDDKSWELLVEKTFGITNSINLFLDFLKELNYPHSDFYSTNSTYAHTGVAAALSNPNTKQQMLNYLYSNGGHGGFNNMIKVFVKLNDREMALSLLDRYIKLCNLLTE